MSRRSDQTLITAASIALAMRITKKEALAIRITEKGIITTDPRYPWVGQKKGIRRGSRDL